MLMQKQRKGVESLILSFYQQNRYLPQRLMLFADTGTDVTTYGIRKEQVGLMNRLIMMTQSLISNSVTF